MPRKKFIFAHVNSTFVYVSWMQKFTFGHKKFTIGHKPGVCAYHVAGLQDQRGMMAKPLRTLNLANAVSVDRRSALAAAGTGGRTSKGMTVEG